MLNYLEVKKDKMDEPIPISEDSDKVQLKLKKPDFYCEGFLSLIDDYGKSYIPYQDAEHIVNNLANNLNNMNDYKINNDKNKIKQLKTVKTVVTTETLNKDDIEPELDLNDFNVE
jgi:hypothetical protein